MNADRSEQLADPADPAEAAAAFEGEIRDLIRNREVGRDVTYLRTPAAKGTGDVSNINSLIQRVTGTSTLEIDNLIDQLQDMREFLQSEGERISREIAGYAEASQKARAQMEAIGDQITQWRSRMESPPLALTHD
jgi:hypothetical protein